MTIRRRTALLLLLLFAASLLAGCQAGERPLPTESVTLDAALSERASRETASPAAPSAAPLASPTIPPTPLPVLPSATPEIEEPETAVSQPTALDRSPVSLVSYPAWDHVLAAAWSPDGSLLAASAGQVVYIYHYPEMEEVQRLNIGAASSSLHFNPAPTGERVFLAAAARSGKVQIWEARQGELYCSFFAHRNGANRALFHPTSGQLASVGMDAMVRLWDIASILAGETAPEDCQPALAAEMIGGARAVPDLAFKPDGTMVASIDQRLIRLRDPLTQRLIHSFQAGGPVYALAFSPDGSLLASAGTSSTVQLWDTATLELAARLQPEQAVSPGAAAFAWSLSFHPGGSRLAVGNSNSSILIWELPESSETAAPEVLQGHSAAVASLAYHPSGEVLASGSLDGTLRLWYFNAP